MVILYAVILILMQVAFLTLEDHIQQCTLIDLGQSGNMLVLALLKTATNFTGKSHLDFDERRSLS